jgi:hypothetical protein
VINQAKWKQAPVMVVISFTGYVVSFFSSRHFPSKTRIASGLSAFVIGVMGSLHSRLQHGVAAAAVLPAIFVQVPSGLAATGSLLSGLTFADEMTRNLTGAKLGDKATVEFEKVGASATTYSVAAGGDVMFALVYGMVQVAIGITVGLFLSALVMYPLGKRRTDLLSF